jgi:deoxycytidylate deaminase
MATDRPLQIKDKKTEKVEFFDSELVIGVVCAVGTNYAPIEASLHGILRQYGYTTRTVKISELITRFTDRVLPDAPETARINERMTAGNIICKATKRQDIWALAAIAQINKSRRDQPNDPLPRVAHIILSLKRPAEVATLRKVYGDGFFLVGVFATEKERLDYLIEKNAPKDAALELIERDAQERKDEFSDYGQQTTETFHLADVFVQFRNRAYEKQLERFLQLVFSDPYVTPTQREHAMFLAYAASLRSAQLGRQVGAAIATEAGDVLAVGCNDVPKAGGGLYWPGQFDFRDHWLKEDSNDKERNRIAEDLLQQLAAADIRRLQNLREQVESTLCDEKMTKEDSQRVADELIRLSAESSMKRDAALRSKYRDILDITEYGRAVHAEMDALMTCSRSGVSPKGAVLYATTFPCHNCTRHIISAGIQRVYYIEPYPKSKAELLHKDAIVVEEKALERKRSRDKKVPFTHFVGVGPRRFFDLFSLAIGSGHELIRKINGETIPIEKPNSWTRIPLSPYSYLQREVMAVELLDVVTSQQIPLDITSKQS